MRKAGEVDLVWVLCGGAARVGALAAARGGRASIPPTRRTALWIAGALMLGAILGTAFFLGPTPSSTTGSWSEQMVLLSLLVDRAER